MADQKWDICQKSAGQIGVEAGRDKDRNGDKLAVIRHAMPRTRGTTTGATDLLNDHNPKEHPPLIRNSNVTTCASEVPPRSFISGGIVVAFITVLVAVTERNSCAGYSYLTAVFTPSNRRPSKGKPI